ncbi:recombinase family protein [Paenibacillus sp. FSL H8-0317]|uniref:recombinase family protein n=1 Tax=Paenibacillus sp. FSL H8-0317 TaxID=2921385 RepID=UPI00324FAF7D
MRQVAVYPRVSTGMQASEGTSLEGQLELCYKKARSLNISKEEIREYIESGFTGEDIDRPALNALMQDVKDKKIGKLIVTHPDRLTRDLTDKLIICRELEKNDVELIFVDTEYLTTPEGQLFFNMMSSIAQYELQLIKKRTVRGRIRAVEKDGKIMPMRVAPYGYNLAGGELTINQEEAKFVHLIYQWYVHDGKTLREIGEELSKLGAIPKRAESKAWNASSISRILTSQIYIGKYFYNKRETRKLKGQKTAKGKTKKTYKIRDETEWIQVNVPLIINEELFNLAQIQRGKNLTRKGGNVKHTYLLKSLMRCGHCGRRWESTTYNSKKQGEKVTYPIYRCSGKYPRKFGESVHKCPVPTLRTDILDDFVWNIIIKLLNNPDEIISRLKSTSNSPDDNLKDLVAEYSRQLKSKEDERTKIKLMFRKGIINEEELDMDISQLDKEKTKIQCEHDKIQSKLNARNKHEVTQEQLINLAKEYKKFMKLNLSSEDKRFIVDKLIDEIIITHEKDKNRFSISCTGYLGNKFTLHNDSYVNLVSSTQRQEVRQYG